MSTQTIDRVYLRPGHWPHVAILRSMIEGEAVFTAQLVGLPDGSHGEPAPSPAYGGESHTREWSADPLPVANGGGLSREDCHALRHALQRAALRIYGYEHGDTVPAVLP